MPFIRGATYVAKRSFETYETIDEVDQPAEIFKGREYKCDENRNLIDSTTGEILKIRNHVSDRPEWYFERQGSFGLSSSPTQLEYVSAILRFADGFDRFALWTIVEKEDSGPLETKIKDIDGLSKVLTIVVATKNFEIRDELGIVVTGIRHNKKNCTFHRKSRVA